MYEPSRQPTQLAGPFSSELLVPRAFSPFSSLQAVLPSPRRGPGAVLRYRGGGVGHSGNPGATEHTQRQGRYWPTATPNGWWRWRARAPNVAEAYTFRTVVYEREGTWVAHAADARLSGFGESKAECLADLRAALERYVESLGGSYRVAVKKPRRTNGELRQLGALITVEIPNPHPQRPAFARLLDKLSC